MIPGGDVDTKEVATIKSDTPFMEGVIVEELSCHFQPLQIRECTGAFDPEDNLFHFEMPPYYTSAMIE